MHIDRATMTEWVIDALRNLGGSGEIVDICKEVWKNHEQEINSSGDMFYKWQYEIRWAGDLLRRRGDILPASQSSRGIWQLARSL